MLIALDIGNSSISIGYFAGRSLFVQKIDTHPLMSSRRYLSLLRSFIEEKNIDKEPEGVIISSVVPGHTAVLKTVMKKLTSVEPLELTAAVKTGLKFNIPEPEKLGPDRMANSVEAYKLFKTAVAVVDFGTATTISIVGPSMEYIGGSIMAGIRLMNQALESGASRLHEVELRPPGSALGTTTEKCIQSGLFYGTAGAVERLLYEIEREVGIDLKVVVTGGYGAMLSGFLSRNHVVVPYLTLNGLRTIYRRNKGA